MMPALEAVVGNEVGWDLELFTVEGGVSKTLWVSGSQDYNAELEIALQGGLESGSCSVALEGITAEDYEQVNVKWSRQPVYARLYLAWRDTGSLTGKVSSLAGLTSSPLSGTLPEARKPEASSLVAELRVTRFSRRMGSRRYEALLEGHERVYDALLSRVKEERDYATCLEAAVQVAKSLGVDVVQHPLPDGKDLPGPETKWRPPAGTGLEALRWLAQRMEELHQRYGRGVLLLRDGVLHVGAGRPIPLSGAAKVLDFSSGLIQAETSGTHSTDPRQVREAPGLAGQAARATYQLLLKGRPDLKPGDVVEVSLPGQATASFPSFEQTLVDLEHSFSVGAPEVTARVSIYITGVMHRLSRAAGFTTTVAGVDLLGKGQEWDRPTEVGRPVPHGTDPRASADGRVASALRSIVRSGPREPLEVGEVRQSHVQGSAEPPSQTVSVWRGLEPGDGRPRQARRLPVDRQPRALLGGIPYVTPFAWGRCGLVLPRYPGTRVLLGHHLGHEDDPVELGALWESGHGPDSQPGDWWLILPAGVPSAQRQFLQPGQVPQEPSGTATNDLTDADGNRVIEVGKLTVRIGQELLNAPGTRPEPAEGAVTIEHEKGSRIVIKQNGDIVIHSEGALSLAAKTTLTLEADDVKVKVRNAMDVGDRT
jgi:hypothetical protein